MTKQLTVTPIVNAAHAATVLQEIVGFEEYLTTEAKEVYNKRFFNTVNPPEFLGDELKVVQFMGAYMRYSVPVELISFHDAIRDPCEILAEAFNYGVQQGWFRGVFWPCLWVSLAPHEGMLSGMVQLNVVSTLTQEDLNAKYGCYLFTKEGELPQRWQKLAVTKKRLKAIPDTCHLCGQTKSPPTTD